MSEAAWVALLGAVAGGVIGGLVSWIKEAADNVRHTNRLAHLERLLSIRALMSSDDRGREGVQSEIERLTAWVGGRDKRRSWWFSLVGFLFGWTISLLPVAALQMWFYPNTLSAPWLLIPIALAIGVIFAIESQPNFLRPLVARFAPGRPSKRRRTK